MPTGHHADNAKAFGRFDGWADRPGPNAAAVVAVAPKLSVGRNEIAVLFAAMVQVLVEQKVQQRLNVAVLKRLPPSRTFHQILRRGRELPIDFCAHRECAF
jgi:hypothetical protein